MEILPEYIGLSTTTSTTTPTQKVVSNSLNLKSTPRKEKGIQDTLAYMRLLLILVFVLISITWFTKFLCPLIKIIPILMYVFYSAGRNGTIELKQQQMMNQDAIILRR